MIVAFCTLLALVYPQESLALNPNWPARRVVTPLSAPTLSLSSSTPSPEEAGRTDESKGAISLKRRARNFFVPHWNDKPEAQDSSNSKAGIEAGGTSADDEVSDSDSDSVFDFDSDEENWFSSPLTSLSELWNEKTPFGKRRKSKMYGVGAEIARGSALLKEMTKELEFGGSAVSSGDDILSNEIKVLEVIGDTRRTNRKTKTPKPLPLQSAAHYRVIDQSLQSIAIDIHSSISDSQQFQALETFTPPSMSFDTLLSNIVHDYERSRSIRALVRVICAGPSTARAVAQAFVSNKSSIRNTFTTLISDPKVEFDVLNDLLRIIFYTCMASDDALEVWRNENEVVRAVLKLRDNSNSKSHAVTCNKILAAIGYNEFIPKRPGQKGLRILTLDGGGSKGVATISVLKKLVEKLGGGELSDHFDMIAGTSTGAIIAFLVGLRRESIMAAERRYSELIGKIFKKGSLASTKMIFTTASYSHEPFQEILQEVLGDVTMIDSRGDQNVPMVFAVASKMSYNPARISVFRNYNYRVRGGRDSFLDADEESNDSSVDGDLDGNSFSFERFMREELLPPAPKNDEDDSKISQLIAGYSADFPPGQASRHQGSFRIPQRIALRATTAAPTVFKPVLMANELYADGGVTASNPAAIAIHEAQCLYPGVPIELVVSVGTGEATDMRTEGKIGWDAIIGQLINSATDGELIHQAIKDTLKSSKSKYYRLNPPIGLPTDFAIDEVSETKLNELRAIATNYCETEEIESQLNEIAKLCCKGKKRGRVKSFFRGKKKRRDDAKQF